MDLFVFLKNQGKIIVADIIKHLKKLGKSSDAEDNTNEFIANVAVNSYVSDTWAIGLSAVLTMSLSNIYSQSIDEALDGLTESVSGQIVASFGTDEVLHGLSENYSKDRTAALVTQLDDSTRDMLRSDLVDYMNSGLTIDEISLQLQESYAFSEKRARVIGRTETGFAWNHGAISMYSQVEGATGVLVFDGDHDTNCQDADGQTWSFEYALEHLLQHPNCVRSFGISYGEPDIE